MKKTTDNSGRTTVFIGTYGYGVTVSYIKDRNTDDGEASMRSFRAMFVDNPFLQLLGTESGCVMAYEDWTHARHVTSLNGVRRHLVTLLKVEMTALALEKLAGEHGYKKVANTQEGKSIWQLSLHALLKLTDDEATFTVLAPTACAAVPLDEFELPAEFVSQLRQARADCLQSLLPAMMSGEGGCKELCAQFGVDFEELLAKLVARVRQLEETEREELIELVKFS